MCRTYHSAATPQLMHECVCASFIDVDLAEVADGTSGLKMAASCEPIEQMIRTALSLQPTSNTCFNLDNVNMISLK